MFEVGRLVARISLEGAQTFGADLEKVGSQFSKLDDKGRQASTHVGTALSLVGGAILGVAAIAVSKFAEFDKAMSEVNAVTQTTTENQAKLRKAAIDAGAATAYSATEAAKAETSLAKAGVETADIIGGGLTGALSLAAAGQVDVADAADTAATAMTQFHLKGSAIPHLADLLAAGAGKAQGGVSDLSLALKQSGLVASQFGISVDDTVGALSAFASAGLIGSDAGTSFKQALLSLANPSSQAADALKQYNIHAYDAEGHFVGLANLAGQLQDGLRGATDAEKQQALATIFGTDAIRVANVLYDQGADGIQNWTDKVNDSGYAARQAAALQNNLSGDIEKLGGSLDTVFIQTGSAANDVMRQMVQNLTDLINWYGALDPAVQQIVLVLGLGVGALALFSGGLLIAIPKIVEFRAALQTLNKEVPALGSGLGKVGSFLAGPWGIGLTAGVAILGRWAEVQVKAKTNLDALTDSLDKQTGAITENTHAVITKQLQDQGVYDAAKKAGISVREVNAAVFDGGRALDNYNQRTAEYYASVGVGGNIVRQFTGEAAALSDGVNVARSDIEAAKDAQQNLTQANQDGAAAAGAAADAQTTAGQAYEDQAQKVDDLQNALSQLIDTINKANGVGQDAVTTNQSYQDALAKVKDTIDQAKAGHDGYSLSLDQNTAEGSKNAAMFADLAQKSQDAALAQYKLDGNTDAYRQHLQDGRQTLIDQITALTGNKDAAQKLADQIYRIPTQREFKIIGDTADAARTIDDFIARYGRLSGTINYRAQLPDLNGDVSGSGRMGTNAVGGIWGYSGSAGMVRAFAGGGTFRESHVAQIAAAGAMRLWAEPETGGEIYAPLAQSKRGRSLEILSTTLDQWGYDVVPKRRGAAAAATSGAGGAGGGMFVGNLYLDSGEFMGKVRGEIGAALDDEARKTDSGWRETP